MNHRRWMLTVGVGALLCLTCGCMADQVVYVDKQGNELAVNAQGRPILPQPAPAVREQAPVLATAPAPAPAPAPVARPVPRSLPTAALMPAPKPTRTLRPTSAPDYDLPPAGAAPRSPAAMPELPPGRKIAGRKTSGRVPPRKVPAARRVDSSAGLDLPPAGS